MGLKSCEHSSSPQTPNPGCKDFQEQSGEKGGGKGNRSEVKERRKERVLELSRYLSLTFCRNTFVLVLVVTTEVKSQKLVFQ